MVLEAPVRKLIFTATVFALLLGLSSVQSAKAQWPSSTHRDLRMSVEFGGKAYNRPGVESNLPVVSDSITGMTLFSQGEATDLGATLGGELKLNFVNGRDREIEVRTMLANWDESASFAGTNLASSFFPVGTIPNTFDYNYESDFFSIEVNRRRAIMPGVTVLAGPRFVSTSDSIETVSTLPVGITNVSQTNFFEATNSLIGLQGGLELNFPVTDFIYFNSYIRAGGYYNPVEVGSSSFNDFTLASTSNGTTGGTEAFLGEVGGRLSLDLLPNCVSGYVGYEATWIDGIALIPANVNLVGGTIDTNNTAFFEAVTFGVQILY